MEAYTSFARVYDTMGSAFAVIRSVIAQPVRTLAAAIRLQNTYFLYFTQVYTMNITDSHVASLLGMTGMALYRSTLSYSCAARR